MMVETLSAPIDAVVRVPGSKSITNRALVTAALAAGTSRLTGVLFADDTEAMLDALRLLGVELHADHDAATVVVVGLAGALPPSPIVFDARLSGATSRFLVSVLALGVGPYTLDGGEPLRARPMADGLRAIESLGATVTSLGQPGHLPVTISGGGDQPNAPAAETAVRGDVSSQFLSGLLLSGPCRPAGLTVRVVGDLVSRPYVDMTIAVMQSFGAYARWDGPDTIRVAPGGYRGTEYHVEPDASAASYFFAAAAITGGRVLIPGLGAASQQGDIKFVSALEAMGASVVRQDNVIEVRGTGVLHGITVDFTDLSDTAQTLATTAVFADSPTTVTGIGFIRRKETDRLAAVVTELRRCGIQAEELDDGFTVYPGHPRPATIRTYHDHRMAMSFALLGLLVPGIDIADPDCVAKTFPSFWQDLASLAHGGNAAE